MNKIKSNPLRIIFAGTSNFSAYQLDALINSSHNIVGVITKPDFPIRYKNYLNINAVKKKHKNIIFQYFNLIR